MPKEQIETATGEKIAEEPTKDEPQGSLLGQCTWTTEKRHVIVSARPAGEFDATTRKGTDVADVGEAAKKTSSGLMVKLAGKPYFLHIMTMAGTEMNHDKAEDVGKAFAAHLK